MSTQANSIPKVEIIILNRNNWKDTVECLQSLFQIDYTNFEVIIVDNGSENDSISRIRDFSDGKLKINSKFYDFRLDNTLINLIEYQEDELEFHRKLSSDILDSRHLILIKNKKNYGFAMGNNLAIVFALEFLQPHYILLLNNDVVVEKHFLKEMIMLVNNNRDIGIAGPKVYYYDLFGKGDVINFAGEDLVLWKAQGQRYGFNEIDKGQYDSVREVDKVEGSCMLIKSEVFQNVGLFDPDYFAYWEETDFCIRAKRKGYKILYSPKSKVWHKISASTGGLRNPFYIYYMTRNKFLFVSKNGSELEKAKFVLYFFIFKFWTSSAYYLLWRRKIGVFIAFIKGVRDGLFLL